MNTNTTTKAKIANKPSTANNAFATQLAIKASKSNAAKLVIAQSQAVGDVDLVAALNDLRIKAGEHFQQYEVHGRDAMLQLLADVYTNYEVAAKTNMLVDLIAELKEKLKGEARPAPGKSTNCAVLIRYIFKGFSAKQVHQYGRSLEIACGNQIKPANFVEFVDAAGGIEKLCRAHPVNGGVSVTSTSVDIAVTMAKNASVEQQIAVTDWAPSERVRIYIGIQNDGGQVSLVNAKLSEKDIEATLNRYRIENDMAKKEKTAKAKKITETKLVKKLIAQLAEKQSKTELRVLQAERQLHTVLKSGQESEKVMAQIRLDLTREQLQETEAEIQALEAQLVG